MRRDVNVRVGEKEVVLEGTPYMCSEERGIREREVEDVEMEEGVGGE